jgi:hypothetical protein
MSSRNIDVLNIGKPSAYHESVDPFHRIGRFLRSRMSVIDLIPCYFKIDFAKATDSELDSSGLVPKVAYDEAIPEYQKTCTHHGLPGVSAIRLFTTDDTTVSDTISNNLKDNYFQQGVNAMSEKLSPLRDMLGSVDSNLVEKMVREQTSKVTTGLDTGDKLLKTAANIIGKGHRVSLPSIWSDSNYAPNFQAVIKLASPYGDPKSIKEFIIKPLMYLLILASPKTTDGVTYGKPFCLTIKGYGLNYSPIGMISNITLRRGGNDTSFNIYKQPLTIDVSLDFNYLVKGFAAYTYESESNSDENLFGTAEDYEYIQRENGDTALPTLGHIVKSLRPKFPDISTEPHSNMKAANVFKPVKSKFTTSLISPISTISSTNNEVKNEMKNVYSDLLDISEEIDLTYV